jgi:hypothetical protein
MMNRGKWNVGCGCECLTEQGKSKKLKGTHKEKNSGLNASASPRVAPQFIYGDYLFTFYFLLLKIHIDIIILLLLTSKLFLPENFFDSPCIIAPSMKLCLIRKRSLNLPTHCSLIKT